MIAYKHEYMESKIVFTTNYKYWEAVSQNGEQGSLSVFLCDVRVRKKIGAEEMIYAECCC